MSLVIYLDDHVEGTGGETRFLDDPQSGIPIRERDLADQKMPGKEESVIYTVMPKAGRALLFNHRILHESHLFTGEGEKNIIRTDVMFNKL